MLEQRAFAAFLILILHRFLENAPIARFLNIRRHAQDQPQRVVIKAGTDVIIAAAGQGLVLVKSAAALQLRRRQIENSLAGALRDHVHDAQQILGGIAETHAAANAALKIGSGPGHIERRHILVSVPDIDHAVGVLIWRLHLQLAQMGGPALPQRVESSLGIGLLQVLRDQRLDAALVDRLRAGGNKLFLFAVLLVAEQEDDLFLLSRCQLAVDMMRSNRLPAMRNGISRFAALHDERLVPTAVSSQKIFTLRVETSQWLGTGEV